MKRIKNFKSVKDGDWLLSLDKPKVIFIIKNKISQAYIFGASGVKIKNGGIKSTNMKNIIDTHIHLGEVYKLNEKEKEKYNRIIILENLK